MTAGDAESWAKLRLVEGESSAMKWELVSSLGHTTLTVGSNSDCTWVVRADGVRPIHFSLHWDGNTLRAADVYSAGDVRVDGAPLTSQWKPLLGRSRIEFGRAALVVESSAGSQPRSGDHPLEGPKAVESRRPAQQRSGKETLIGVAPNMLAGLVTPAARPIPDSSSPPPAHSSPAGPSSSRPPAGTPMVTRPASDRSMKATLVGGIGISPVPTPLSQPAATNPKANATLVGISPVDALRGAIGVGQPGQGASLGAADQRTAQGFPREGQSSNPPAGGSGPTGRRMTQKGMVSQQPGVSPDAVARAPVRNVASDPPGTSQQRINSAWQERPDEREMGGRTLRGMSNPPTEDPDRVPGAPRVPRMNDSRWGELGDRMSDIPTQMRDPASFESRRPSRGFPWRYVGVLVLTAVAYFAWLYLLDHM